MSSPGWTLDTLQEHTRAVLVERDRQMDERFRALENALLAEIESRDLRVSIALAAAREAVVGLEKWVVTGFESRDTRVTTALTSAGEGVGTLEKAMLTGFEARDRQARIDILAAREGIVVLEKAMLAGFQSRDTQVTIALASAHEAVLVLEKAMLAGFTSRDAQVTIALSSAREATHALEQIVLTGFESREARMRETVETLEKAVASGFDAREKIVNGAFAANREAIVKAELSIEKRLDSVNEFRKTLSDQTASFVPRQELDQRFLAVEKSVDHIDKQLSETAGKSHGLNQGWGILLGAIGFIVALVTLFQNLIRR